MAAAGESIYAPDVPDPGPESPDLETATGSPSRYAPRLLNLRPGRIQRAVAVGAAASTSREPTLLDRHVHSVPQPGTAMLPLRLLSSLRSTFQSRVRSTLSARREAAGLCADRRARISKRVRTQTMARVGKGRDRLQRHRRLNTGPAAFGAPRASFTAPLRSTRQVRSNPVGPGRSSRPGCSRRPSGTGRDLAEHRHARLAGVSPTAPAP